MNGTKHKNRHYAWIVMIGCGLMISGSIGFFTVVAGSFYVPVSQSLGVEESTLAWYMTIVSLGQAISMPLAGRLVPRMNIPVHMTLICAVEALAGAAMAFYTDVLKPMQKPITAPDTYHMDTSV